MQIVFLKVSSDVQYITFFFFWEHEHKHGNWTGEVCYSVAGQGNMKKNHLKKWLAL